MTYAKVKQAWFDESMDLACATEKQISRLCDDIECGDPLARWDDYQEELRYMMAEFI